MRHLFLAVAVSACGTDELYLRNQTAAADETEAEVETEVVDEDTRNPFCHDHTKANCELVAHKWEHPYNPSSIETTKSRQSPWCNPHVRRAIYGEEDRSIHRKREQLCEKGEAQ